MSAVQSQVQTGTETLGFDIQQRSLPMNVRTDAMIRQQGMPHLPPNMMNMNSPHFIPPNQPHGQQSLAQPPMGLLQNTGQPPMGLLAGAQPNVGPSQNNPNYQAQMQARKQQQMMLQQSQGLQQPGGLAPGMNGMVPNSLQNMGFPNGMMPQQVQNAQIRRMVSQPQGMNQAGPHTAPMHAGQQGPAGMGMSPQQMQQMRQQQAVQQMGMRMSGQPQPPMPGGMTQDMMRAHMQANAGMSSGVARAPSAGAPLMPQPPSMGQPHAAGLQQSLQNSFPNPMNLPHSQSIPSSSPRPPSHSQNPIPGSMGVNMPVQSQPGNRPRMTPGPGPGGPDTMFMSMQNQPFPPNMQQHNVHRIPPPTNSQFSFGSSSSPQPPNQDMSQPMAGGLAPPGPPNRPNFHPTPAQQYEQMQANDSFSPHMNMGPPQSNVPARPPSQQQPHPQPHPMSQQPQAPPHHHSPHQSDQANARVSQPLRPQSQPQPQQVHHPSQPAVQSRTPHAQQQPLPGNPQPQQRLPAGMQPAGMQQQQQQRPMQMPPQAMTPGMPGVQPSIVPPVPNDPALHPLRRGVARPDQPPVATQPTLQPRLQNYPVGTGQALLKVTQFSQMLSNETTDKTTLRYWKDAVTTWFGSKAQFRFTLWKDNQRNEAKPFVIGPPILPRFFLVTHQSGVKAMSINMEGANERLYNYQASVVESPAASWTFRYTNGYVVTLRGALSVVVSFQAQPSQHSNGTNTFYKLETITFDAWWHDKAISLENLLLNRVMVPGDSPKTPRSRPPHTPNASVAAQQREEERRNDDGIVTIDRLAIPPEPVNAFGIPQATMRCLELAESVGQMTDLIEYSSKHQLGPMEALKQFAQKLRETQGHASTSNNPHGTGPGNLGGDNTLSSGSLGQANGSAGPSSSTLYPPGNPPNSHAGSSSLSQNAPPTPDASPLKQHKVLQQPTPGPTSANTPATQSTPTPANATPSMAPATLKRKGGPSDATPSGGSDNPPAAKRITRKRGRTNTGG